MWQVAVLSPTQHAQFCTAHDRFALVQDRVDRCWRLVEQFAADELAGGNAIVLGLDGASMTVDCRGMEGPLAPSCGDSFSTDIPALLPIPCLFQISDAWFEIREELADATTLCLEPLRDGMERPGPGESRAADFPLASSAPGPEGHTITSWLAALAELHRTAASSPRFFTKAAELSRAGAGLDSVLVLSRTQGAWQIVGSVVNQPRYGLSYHPAVLRLITEKPEVWRRTASPRLLALDPAALPPCEHPDAIVAAPAKNEAGDVVAALYGIRHGHGENRRRGIRTLEARFLALMAEAIAVGMTRRVQEIESARRQVLLEQAFSVQTAEQLLRHPDALTGQTREVSLLFAHLRQFTSIAEQLPPADVDALLTAVMETLTQAITDHGGVVVDCFDDGVSAMWNAPLDVTNHADRACAAALQMLARLPDAARTYRGVLATPLEIAIGMHCGTAHVGSAGTHQRLKYGPRGNAVNIARGVQAAAARLDVALLVSNEVRRRLSAEFITLKVCTARLPGHSSPLELLAAFPSTDAERLQGDLGKYAAALDAFEHGDLEAAEQQLADLLARGPSTPAAFLAEQAAALRNGSLGRRATDEFRCTPDAVIEILAK